MLYSWTLLISTIKRTWFLSSSEKLNRKKCQLIKLKPSSRPSSLTEYHPNIIPFSTTLSNIFSKHTQQFWRNNCTTYSTPSSQINSTAQLTLFNCFYSFKNKEIAMLFKNCWVWNLWKGRFKSWNSRETILKGKFKNRRSSKPSKTNRSLLFSNPEELFENWYLWTDK